MAGIATATIIQAETVSAFLQSICKIPNMKTHLEYSPLRIQYGITRTKIINGFEFEYIEAADRHKLFYRGGMIDFEFLHGLNERTSTAFYKRMQKVLFE